MVMEDYNKNDKVIIKAILVGRNMNSKHFAKQVYSSFCLIFAATERVWFIALYIDNLVDRVTGKECMSFPGFFGFVQLGVNKQRWLIDQYFKSYTYLIG